ncbi:Tubulin polyglutamylase ttll4 [Phlyctochytrium bullatum]|nr:Tubulin polyglutamylase ttll4 [Phlyctochytrium bullatum]
MVTNGQPRRKQASRASSASGSTNRPRPGSPATSNPNPTMDPTSKPPLPRSPRRRRRTAADPAPPPEADHTSSATPIRDGTPDDLQHPVALLRRFAPDTAVVPDNDNGDDGISAAGADDDEEEQEISDFDEVVETSDEESLTDSGISLRSRPRMDPADSAVCLDPAWDDAVKSPIVPSLFDDGEPVIYFPTVDEQVRKVSRELAGGMYWKVCKFTPKVVRDTLRRAGFKLIKGGRNWAGYWGKHFPPEKFKHVHPWQKVNHFPMSFELGRKDRMYVNVSRMRTRVGEQRRSLRMAFGKHPLWIVKPPAAARGIGIKVVAKWKDLPRKKDVVVSRYIGNPYLIQGRKFDLRLYVAVTSFDPLRIYLFREGVVRFAADLYTTNTTSKDVRNRFGHLTNYSVSKKPKGAAQMQERVAERAREDMGERFPIFGCKWSFDTLAEYLATKGEDFGKIMASIKDLIVKTIVSVNTVNASGVRLCVASNYSCYEVFGFDVLLDANLKPWLMEVNISPSLKASSDMDYAIKSRMVTDLFNLVGVRVRDVEECRRKKPTPKPRTGPPPSERQKHRELFRNPDMDCLADLTEDDVRVLKESEDENRRRGNFERLLPSPTSSRYFPYFSHVGYYDRLLEQWTRRSRADPTAATLLLQRFHHHLAMPMPIPPPPTAAGRASASANGLSDCLATLFSEDAVEAARTGTTATAAAVTGGSSAHVRLPPDVAERAGDSPRSRTEESRASWKETLRQSPPRSAGLGARRPPPAPTARTPTDTPASTPSRPPRAPIIKASTAVSALPTPSLPSKPDVGMQPDPGLFGRLANATPRPSRREQVRPNVLNLMPYQASDLAYDGGTSRVRSAAVEGGGITDAGRALPSVPVPGTPRSMSMDEAFAALVSPPSRRRSLVDASPPTYPHHIPDPVQRPPSPPATQPGPKTLAIRFNAEGSLPYPEPGDVARAVGGVSRMRSIRNAFATMKRGGGIGARLAAGGGGVGPADVNALLASRAGVPVMLPPPGDADSEEPPQTAPFMPSSSLQFINPGGPAAHVFVGPYGNIMELEAAAVYPAEPPAPAPRDHHGGVAVMAGVFHGLPASDYEVAEVMTSEPPGYAEAAGPREPPPSVMSMVSAGETGSVRGGPAAEPVEQDAEFNSDAPDYDWESCDDDEDEDEGEDEDDGDASNAGSLDDADGADGAADSAGDLAASNISAPSRPETSPGSVAATVAEDRDLEEVPVQPLFPLWGAHHGLPLAAGAGPAAAAALPSSTALGVLAALQPDPAEAALAELLKGRRRKEATARRAERAVVAVSKAAARSVVPVPFGSREVRGKGFGRAPGAPGVAEEARNLPVWERSMPAVRGRSMVGTQEYVV